MKKIKNNNNNKIQVSFTENNRKQLNNIVKKPQQIYECFVILCLYMIYFIYKIHTFFYN